MTPRLIARARGFSLAPGVLGAAMERVAPQVFLRPIGSPLTVGMSGLVIASLVQSGFDLRWIAESQATEVGLILLAVPFVLQPSVFSYLARDGAGGAALGVLPTTWAAMGLIHVVSVPGSRSGALGLLLLAAGGALALSTLAVAAGKPLPGLVFGTAAARFVLAGAFELEGQQRRPVLPTFRRGRGALVIRDGIDAQVDGIAHEAGVRRTT